MHWPDINVMAVHCPSLRGDFTTDHLDLPPDLANGMVLSIMKNTRPDTPETKVSMVLAAPKPQLVKLAISPHGEEPFSIAGSPPDCDGNPREPSFIRMFAAL